MIRYKCEECGSVLNIKDEKAGQRGHCPKCHAEFLIPQPEQAQQPVAAAVGPDSSHELAATSDSGDLSEDEIERILESKEGLPKTDGYGMVDTGDDEEPLDEDPHDAMRSRRGRDDEDEDDEEEERPKQKKKKKSKRDTDELPAADPSLTAAALAKNLMARGDKAAPLERAERKGGRGFGEHERDDTDEEGFSKAEILTYFARWVVPVAIAIGIGLGLYGWWYSGWQRGDVPDLEPIAGTITLDGVPLQGAEVQFFPQQEDAKKAIKVSASNGFTDAAGKYRLSYVQGVYGAVAGRHRVQISCYSPEGLQLVPAHYNTRSKLEVVVKEGGNSAEDFALQSAPDEGAATQGGFNPQGQ